uniref:Arrestin C-terminal-like domain-containing protein n=1 Tax=Sparus aurata TaxID=8175 RepID=A0A671TEX9_SPAAU
MLSTIKSFSVGYNPINQSNTFTSGDCITGQITLELAKECEIYSLCVKLKGKAEVSWVELDGKKSKTYHAKEKYFSIKQVIIEESKEPGMLRLKDGQEVKGGQMSFLHLCDQLTLIVNTVNTNVSCSWQIQQQDITEKKLKLFSSGTVSMDANIERTGFHQGEGIKVAASINNKSSRDIKPKYLLYMKISYFAKGKRKLDCKKILKEVDDPIPPSANQAVTRVITIPPDTCVSILNCTILRVEYRLKVYLDVKYAVDPEIKFPVVILPALQGPDGEHLPAGSEAYAGSDMPGGTSFLQNPPASGPFATPPPYETHGILQSGFEGR